MVTPAPITPAQLTTGAVTYYTAPVNTRSKIQKLVFSNNTGTARTVTVYRIPSGGAASNTNKVWDAVTVPPNAAKECFEMEDMVLDTGDFIQALSDANTAVSIQGSVLQFT